MSASMELKDKLRAVNEDLTVDGKPITGVTISQADFAAASEESVAPASAGPVVGDVKATVPKVAGEDRMLNAGGDGGKLSADMSKGDSGTAGEDIADTALFTKEEIIVTDAHREAFISAVLSGGRFTEEFSLFGGAVKGKFRCRSAHESEAIATRMNEGVRLARYQSALAYSVDIRNALLAAQVAELNGVAYSELEAPLIPTSTKGVVADPGWLSSANAWGEKPEPLVAAVYDALRLFEKRYWTMVMHAADQNFWHPAESI